MYIYFFQHLVELIQKLTTEFGAVMTKHNLGESRLDVCIIVFKVTTPSVSWHDSDKTCTIINNYLTLYITTYSMSLFRKSIVRSK